MVRLLQHTGEFIECSLRGFSDENCAVFRAKKRMARALKHMAEVCGRCAESNRSVSRSDIKDFGSAATNLYQTARRESVSDNCDECWHLLGLCFHAIFQNG